jgi:hypothetical protein
MLRCAMKPDLLSPYQKYKILKNIMRQISKTYARFGCQQVYSTAAAVEDWTRVHSRDDSEVHQFT